MIKLGVPYPAKDITQSHQNMAAKIVTMNLLRLNLKFYIKRKKKEKVLSSFNCLFAENRNG